MNFPVDETAVNPQPRRCIELKGCGLVDQAGGNACVSVTVGIGTFEQVHHLVVEETSSDVTVTAWVGTARAVAERTASGSNVSYTMQRLHWSREFPLSAPLGSRALRDGGTAGR